jgi:tRNA modification GTPase
MERCADHLRELLDQAEQGRSLQEGLTVALAGLPNAGKSSLLNYLAGYEAAIVTDIEGTTRDVLREQLSLKGIPVRISDTAGLRDTDNPVEREGVRRARNAIEQADVVLYLVDSTRGLGEADRRILADLPADRLQLVFSKCDLVSANPADDGAAIPVSVVSGEGTELLIQRITGRVADLNQDNQAFMARRRHVEALKLALGNILQARETLAATRSGELVAEDLRGAQRRLNEITGEFSSDDLLGKIFSSFCIGK